MGTIRMSMDSGAIRDAIEQLDAVGELEARAPEALMAGAEIMRAAVYAATPVRSGRLQGTIAIRARGRGAAIQADVGAINSPVAHLVEKGHGGPKPAPAHPFVEPAAQSVEDQVMDAIMARIMEGV